MSIGVHPLSTIILPAITPVASSINWTPPQNFVKVLFIQIFHSYKAEELADFWQSQGEIVGDQEEIIACNAVRMRGQAIGGMPMLG